MKVIIAMQFDGVDPNSPEADEIVEFLTSECDELCAEYGANACWVDDAEADDKGGVK